MVRVIAQLPGWKRIALRYRFRIDFGDLGAGSVFKLVPSVLLVHAISNVNSFVDRAVGSTVAVGTIAALNYGFRLMMLPHGLVTLAVAQVLYPSMGASARVARERFVSLTRDGVGALLVILTPMAVALLVLRVPLVEAVFERGNFDRRDVALTSWAVGGYSVGLVALGCREVINRAFYSFHDTRTPMVIALGGMVINAVGDLTLGRRYGVGGLAATSSIAFVSTLIAGLILLDRRHRGVSLAELAPIAARCSGAGLVAAVAMDVAYRLLRGSWGLQSTASELGLVAIPFSVGLLVYVGVLVALGAPELRRTVVAVRSIVPLRKWR